MRDTQEHRLGYLQKSMLDFCRNHPGRHTIATDYLTVKVARSLERRGLIYITDCGLCTSAGKTVLMVSAVQ